MQVRTALNWRKKKCKNYTEKRQEKQRKRTPMPEQPAGERRKNFNEVALGYTKEDALAEASVSCLQRTEMC